MEAASDVRSTFWLRLPIFTCLPGFEGHSVPCDLTSLMNPRKDIDFSLLIFFLVSLEVQKWHLPSYWFQSWNWMIFSISVQKRDNTCVPIPAARMINIASLAARRSGECCPWLGNYNTSRDSSVEGMEGEITGFGEQLRLSSTKPKKNRQITNQLLESTFWVLNTIIDIYICDLITSLNYYKRILDHACRRLDQII